MELIAKFHGRQVDVQRGTFLGRPDQPLVVIYAVHGSRGSGHVVIPAAVRTPIIQPSSEILYLGYGLALVIGTGVMGWTLLSERRSRATDRRRT